MGQYQVHHYYQRPSDQMSSFIDKEVKYWSVYHKKWYRKRILKQLVSLSSFWKNNQSDRLGIVVFVKNYSSLEQLNKMFDMYTDPDMMKGIDADFDEMANPDYAVGMYVVREEVSLGGLADVYVVNFGKPENLNGFVTENKNLWGPLLFQGLMKSGDTGLISWGVLIYNLSTWIQYKPYCFYL